MTKNTGKIYKVFVSSTYRDNEERRKILQDVIMRAGMIWHGMELFPASTNPVVDECLRYVKEADVLVGIIAHRYGWEPDGKKSITEMEYDAAEERLMFLIDPSLPVNPQKDYDEGFFLIRDGMSNLIYHRRILKLRYFLNKINNN